MCVCKITRNKLLSYKKAINSPQRGQGIMEIIIKMSASDTRHSGVLKSYPEKLSYCCVSGGLISFPLLLSPFMHERPQKKVKNKNSVAIT